MDQIYYIMKFLRERSERNYLLFVTGINLGLRISDLLRLRVRDAKRMYIDLREKKTGKQKRIKINKALKKALADYIKDKDDQEFLFKSREGLNKPIIRSTAYNILKEAVEYVGLDGIGTHTMRKTFGYWHYKKFKDVALLQEIFNHSSPDVTLRYIGITQDTMDQTIDAFSL
ncbi:site-specific integrase [Bacillus paralicheniformis]|uniref:site-specific integrase n=1 Tax=Bacillus paralicheniformis TaxID=1648923 RepID=UPI0013EF1F50|nr:site-specific integrase [Bacillus paralicheniformis]QII48170.1 site-specific integrase [Bacillus paralicheniformis]